MAAIKIKKLHPGVKTPVYSTAGAACFDIFPDLSADQVSSLSSNGTITLGTGLSFELPEGKALMIYSRSGQGFIHDTRLANCVGVIDSDYRGELKVKLTMDADKYLFIKPDTAIAQGMIIDVDQVKFEVVEEINETVRGSNGFGSTDKGKT